MRHLSYQYIMALLAACLLSATFIGCTNEANEPIADGRTATIRLNIPMLEAGTRTTPPTKDQESKINHLRVIILSQGATSINQTFTADDLTGGSITIDNVPVGPVQMYVIANEASLGKDYSDLAKLQEDITNVDGTRKVLIKDESRTYFPKRGSEKEFPSTGLPMEWMGELTIAPPTDTAQTIEISEMTFGKFFGDRLYLFGTQKLDVPTDTSYETYSYSSISIPINGGETVQLALYIYPSFAWTEGTQISPYNIGFKTKTGKEYKPQSFVNDYGALNSIARNTQINIHATLSTSANVEISFEVVPWVGKSVEVPPFN